MCIYKIDLDNKSGDEDMALRKVNMELCSEVIVTLYVIKMTILN